MGTVITFINEKGGIGKTSCCFNVAWAFSEKKRNKKVLMIDMDGQRANLTFFAGIAKETGTPTMYDVLIQEKPIEAAIIEVKDNLDIIPATVNVSNISQIAKINRMKRSVDAVKDKYDYILIDVNPTPNWTHVLSLSASDYVIIPMLPDIASLEANKGIAESLEDIQGTTNPSLKVLGLLFNKNVSNTNLSKEVRVVAERVAQQLNTTVFESKIRQSVPLSENVGLHVGVTEYNPKSNVAKDIQDLVDEIERRIVNGQSGKQ